MNNNLRLTLLAVLLSGLSVFTFAGDLLNHVPRRSAMVVKIDFAALNRTTEFLRKEVVLRDVVRQSGIADGKLDSDTIQSMIDEILIVTPVLTTDYTLVFVKTKVTEEMFCKKLAELTNVRQISVKTPVGTEKRITLPAGRSFSGGSSNTRTFAFAFLEQNIAVFAKDTLSPYRNYRLYGMVKPNRAALNVPKALAAGFLEMSSEFLMENPMLPPFQRVTWSLVSGPAESLRINAAAECPGEEAAKQMQMQVQQYVMIGGIFLNQTAPELMQEWMNAVKVRSEGPKVRLTADFSKRFLEQLAATSEKMTEKADPPTASPAASDGKKKR